LDEEASETSVGEQPCQPGQQRRVSRPECGPVDRATEHGHLVAVHDHLDGQLLSVEPRESDQLSDAEEEEVQEPQRHDAILAAPASCDGTPPSRRRDLLTRQGPVPR